MNRSTRRRNDRVFATACAVFAVLLFPALVDAGCDALTSAGPFGGKFNDFTFDAMSPATVYAGTSNGVYMSSNGGERWSYRGLAGIDVRSVAVVPSTPGVAGIIYAATADGVHKSIDSGVTYSQQLAGVNLEAIAIDPANPLTLYAGGSGDGNGTGLYRTTDGGANWVLQNIGLATPIIYDLAVDPQQPSTVYAATYAVSGSGGGVSKSTDSGVTWTQQSSGLPNSSVYALTLDPTDSSTLYAGMFGTGLFKSTDAATSWSSAGSSLSSQVIQAVAVDPTNPNVVYVGLFFDLGVRRSTDGGTTWTAQNNGIDPSTVNALAVTSTGAVLAGTDALGAFQSVDLGSNWHQAGGVPASVTSLARGRVDTSLIYAATSVGAFKSVDGGKRWSVASHGLLTNPSLPATPSFLAADATEDRFYATSTDGGYFVNADGENWFDWKGSLSGSVVSLAADQSTPELVYVGVLGDGVYRSDFGGGSWLSVPSGLPANSTVHFLYTDPKAQPPVPHALYAGVGTAGIYRTTDGGGIWSQLAFDGVKVNAVAADPSVLGTLYALQDFSAWRSLDDGASWTELTVPGANYTAMGIHPSDSDLLTVATLNGAYRSRDGGDSWTAIPGSETLGVQALDLDPNDPEVVLLATNEGVHRIFFDDEWETSDAGGTGGDENDDTCFGNTILLDSPQHHSHCDADWLSFSAVAGQTYLVEALGLNSTSEPTVSARLSCGSELAFSETGVLVITADAGGNYDLLIQQATDNYDEGDRYSVTVSDITSSVLFADGFESGNTIAWQ